MKLRNKGLNVTNIEKILIFLKFRYFNMFRGEAARYAEVTLWQSYFIEGSWMLNSTDEDFYLLSLLTRPTGLDTVETSIGFQV